MYKKFEKLLEKTHKTTYRVSKETGIAQNVFSNWKSGRSVPKTDKLKILADYFGVSIEYFLEQGGNMNELQIFDNEEFGQIRTVTINNEPWFVGKDVAEALGYERTADAIRQHVEEEDKLTRCFADSGQNRQMYIINESGLYALIFGSKLESAKRFKHWVTSEVLPSIRKTGSYEMEQYSPEMKAILMHDKKLVKMDERVTNLENTMTIDYGQQQVLGEAVNHVVIEHLGGKNSEAYKEIGKKVFAECNRDLKHYFHVNARNNVPKKKFEEAVEYVKTWNPCTNTLLLIKECNLQMNFLEQEVREMNLTDASLILGILSIILGIATIIERWRH